MFQRNAPTSIRALAVLAGGNVGQEVLCEAVTLLRQKGIVALGFRDGNPCLEHDHPIGSSDLSPSLDRLPAGYTIQRIDHALLERSPKQDENLNRYGSIRNFLEHGLAVCILRGADTVCEAYADMDIQGTCELGATTQKAYRGQGFATITCAHLIQLCEAAGSHTYWDCVRFNTGSRAMARKLGFQNERAYKLLAWFKPIEMEKP